MEWNREDVEVLEYINAKDCQGHLWRKGHFRCKECGYEWTAEIYHANKAGCPQCNKIKGRLKREQTLIERYGTTNMFNESTREKAKQTMIEKYGVSCYFSHPDFNQKRIETNREKYGVDYCIHTREAYEKSRQTRIDRYGVPSMLMLDEYKHKAEQTCLEKYGVRNPAQDHDIYTKGRGKYYYNNLYFDSSWELAYYIYNEDQGIILERSPDVNIEYEDNGKLRKYFPDFKDKDKLIEIKGSRWWDKATYNYKKTVLDNSILLTEKEIKPYLEYCKEKFGTRYWYRRFKNNDND